MPAKYKLLADILRTEAAKATSSGENKLPTEAEIAVKYDISRQTVRNALNLLEKEGVIERRQGSGSYAKSTWIRESTKQIAVITTFIDDYIFPSILHDVQKIFAQNGYSILIYSTGNSMTKEREILASLLHQEISAVLIEGSKTALPTPNFKLFEEFRNRNIPLLFFHGTPPNIKGFPSITDENAEGGYKIGKYLINKKHTRIGGIFKSDDSQGPERYFGLISAMIDSGLGIDGRCFCWYDTDDRAEIVGDGGYSTLDRFIDHRLKDCTAIVCYNDEIAYNLIKRLQEKGIEVPKDKAVASFDNSFYSQIGTIPITSLGHKDKKTGIEAATMLLSIVNGESVVSEKIGWELYARKSC